MWIELDLIGDGSYSNDQLLPFITNPGLLPFGHPVAKDLLPFHSPLPFTGITEGQECKRLHLGLHSALFLFGFMGQELDITNLLSNVNS